MSAGDRTRAAATLATFAVVAALNACDDTKATRPDCCTVITEPESAVVSEPLSLPVTAASLQSLSLNAESASNGSFANVGAAERLVYVSLPSGAYPTGTTAIVRNTADGPSLAQPMVDGGFDPIAIPAGVGDTVEITIRAGTVVLATIARAVPRSRRPGVVRTNPPKGKKDVALNSRVTIIFSEPIAANTLTASSIALSRNGASIPGSIQVFAGGLAAEFVPSTPLAPNAAHRLLITRDIRDVEGDELAADVSVEFTTGNVTAAPIISVEVAPPSATLEMGDVLGDSVQLATTVRSALGVVTDREVIWSTSDPSVAVVSSSGLVKARAPGLATITARSEGQEGSAQITVVPIPVDSIRIMLSNPSVSVGGTVYLWAGPLDRHNRALTRRVVEWRSADNAIATVDQRGLVMGIAPGRATITATSEGVSGTVTVAVAVEPLINRVDVSPPGTAVAVNGNVQLTARAYRCDGDIGGCAEVTGQPVTWSSDDPDIAVVDQGGRVNAVSSGTVTIAASVDGMRGSAPITVMPTAPLSFASVSAGYYFTCGLTPVGEAYCWGQHAYGQLGIGRLMLAPEVAPGAVAPAAVTGGLAFSSLSVGGWHVCGLTTGGAVYCWGQARQRQVGPVEPPNLQTCEFMEQQDTVSWACVGAPMVVSGVPEFRALYAGGLHTCALTSTGAAYCWGGDRYGQVGDGGGATSHALPPTPVAGDHRFVSLSGGWRHVCGVTIEGKAYCWGYNYHGQLGDGTHSNRDAPVALASELTFKSVAAGIYHSCGVTTSGDAYCWGDNYYGQLGDGTRSERNGPVAVTGGLTFTSVSVGEWYSCGLTISGAAYCWGGNWSGTLGDGSSSNRDTPVPVAGGYSFTAISAGDIHTCGLTTGRVAYCWGGNQSGQLGDGSVTDRRTPARVAGQP